MNSKQNVNIPKVLRQGCPLSPLCFMTYIVRMERALEGINIGSNSSCKQVDTIVEQQFPGLFHAHDIVLLGNRQSDIQSLSNICGLEGDNLGLKSKVKNQVLWYAMKTVSRNCQYGVKKYLG